MQVKISHIFPLFVSLSFCTTVLAGAVATVLPSFNYFPAMGQTEFSFSPWVDFFSYPGTVQSIMITFCSGMTASMATVSFSFLFIAFTHKSLLWRMVEKSLAPIIAIPHAAFAVGFGFLIAPSGWFLRCISPGITGFHHPPDWLILNDPWGISLATALIIKEVPFLILVIMGAMGQLNVEKTIMAGRSLGYRREQIWIKIILPQLYRQLRLPVFAIVAYSMSVVDMAILLGPSSPPTLGVLILKWFNDPHIQFKLLAASGSLFLFLMVMASIGLIYTVERLVYFLTEPLLINGRRSSVLVKIKHIIFLKGAGILIISLASTVVLLIWSLTWQWRFPDFIPATMTLKHWIKFFNSPSNPVATTILTGIVSAAAALILTIGCLEHELLAKKYKTRNLNRYNSFFLYLPLMIPQITFMTGIHFLLVTMKLDGYWPTLVWSHLLFVLPYTYISLSATYKAYDCRYFHQALVLKKSYLSALFKIKLPMLTRPILFALAIGFSVSVAQYIPTIIVAAGRFSTITTEVVNTASGSDRRILAVYALIQQFLPMVFYGLAILTPKMVFRNRRGME